MQNKFPWADALQVPSHHIQEWSRQIPPEESLLYWCLKNQKIDAKAYLEWAANHYSLPCLELEFFKQPVNASLWQQIQSVANWSPAFVPIRQWDGVIFVACVEPRHDIQWSFPVQYVLAPASGLALYWQGLHSPGAEKSITPPTAEVAVSAPAPVPTTAPSLVASAPSAEDESQWLSQGDGSPDGPDGLKISDGPQGLNIPEGLNLNLKTPREELPPIPESSAPAAMPDLPPPPPDEALQMPEGLNLKLDLPPIPEPATTSPSPSSPPPTPAMGMEGLAPAIQAEMARPEANSDDEAVNFAFQDLKKHFEKSMVLLFEGSSLKVWKHDSGWRPKDASAISSKIDTNQPSFFRIVRRTNLPYHGRVAPSEVNEVFFKTWNGGDIPAHVTAVPILQGGHSLGVVLSVGGTTANTPEVLEAAQKVAQNLITAIQRFGTQAA